MNPSAPSYADPNPELGHCGCGRHKAGDITHGQMISELRTNPGGVKSLVHGLSEEQLAQAAPDGNWSIKQIVDHLAATSGTYYQRVSAMVNQDHPALPRANRGDESVANDRDTGEMLEQYAANEARLANLVMTLDDAQWQRTAIVTRTDGHTYTAVVDDLMVHAIDHDREHMAEIGKLRKTLIDPAQELSGGCVCGLHHAGDISHAQMIAELRSRPRELAAMLQGLDEATLTRPAPNGGWSIKQLVGHLRDAAAMYLERTELMLHQDNPTMPRMSRANEPSYNSNNLNQMLTDLAASDERFAQVLENLTPEQWQRKGLRKSAEGEVRLVVDDTAVHHVDHEREHIAEISKLSQQTT